MPFARITVANPELPVQTRERLAAAVTTLLETDLLKKPEVAVVQINLAPAEHWFVNGVRQPGATGAHLEVSITAGTNTAAERAAFQAHAYQLLVDTLETVPSAVYVALYELDAESYGYNGLSQMARRR